jgi:hypothetical protein
MEDTSLRERKTGIAIGRKKERNKGREKRGR